MDEGLNALRERIEAAYIASGNALGWRFLMSPPAVLDGAQVAFIGLNPGGSVRPSEHAEFAMGAGSAYALESWAGHPPGCSPLQREVLLLFDRIGVAPDTVLAGNLVPFRSRDWGGLRNRKNALRFGGELWRDVLARAGCTLIVTMGAVVTDTIAPMLGCDRSMTRPIGWGKVKGVQSTFVGGTLVGLPHLSRYRVISRPQCSAPLEALFGTYWQ
ncbi:hypothetical protein DLJ53_34095 [Acuticoccus sediminis]|uniref:Uracil DNA glycosylase superfamily protein n=1 Tax=Acuticoccus sediminis TaxID=2184697 RepID=A0A8B2NEK6_9HYPH|nr:hypothetical protein [Acuticoccus sediminis]RAH95677.1 hypothetical protein DLJ53_34095 [Acuticoccus sediminis]